MKITRFIALLTAVVSLTAGVSQAQVTIWEEDFEAALVGSTNAGANTIIPGTEVFARNWLSDGRVEVEAAPAGWTSNSTGKVLALYASTAGFEGLTPAGVNVESLGFTVPDTTNFQLDFDFYLPVDQPSVSLGQVTHLWRNGSAGNNVPQGTPMQTAGEYNVSLTGMISDFSDQTMIDGFQHFIRVNEGDYDGTGPSPLIGYIDNISLSFPDLPNNDRVFSFTEPDFSDAPLNGQSGWNADAGWNVTDSAGNGNARTTDDFESATYQVPVEIDQVGETFSFEIEFEFETTTEGEAIDIDDGAFVYLLQAGLKGVNTNDGLILGSVEPDVNVQLFDPAANMDGDPIERYRVLNNFGTVTGASTINFNGDDPLNSGDVLRLSYDLTLGADAASTTYDVRLQNVTDGTDTGSGTVTGYSAGGMTFTGIDPAIYDLLNNTTMDADEGAYFFFEADGWKAANSNITAVQINEVTATVDEFVAPPALEGDYNGDGMVNAADYTVWRDTLAAGGVLPNNETASPGVTDQADYLAWRNNYGADNTSGVGAGQVSATPEPSAAVLFLLGLIGLASKRRV